MGLNAVPMPTFTHRSTLPADVNPVEHFQQMLRVLVDHDNLFGPQQVILAVHEQISIIQQLRSSWRGTDQQARPWQTVPTVADFRTAMKDTISSQA